MAPTTWIAADADSSTGKRRMSQIRQLARGFLPCKIIDLGAGTCEIALRLKQDGAEVLAVDWTIERVIDEAKQFFVQTDATILVPDEFDLIVCAGLLYHLSIEQQQRCSRNWSGKPVILDTHFSRTPDTTVGEYFGQYREPTKSTRVSMPFVHTVPSLRRLFASHHVIETFERTTPDRQTFLLIPRASTESTCEGGSDAT